MKILTYDGDYVDAVAIIPADDSPMNPNSLMHSYAYNGDGTLASDTATGRNPDNAVHTWQKTYSYTNGNLSGESSWVRLS